jgi:hypothetical protein
MRYLFLSTIAAFSALANPLSAEEIKNDVTYEIPIIDTSIISGYTKVEDVAQYGKADWSQAVGIAQDISVERAKQIADANPDIMYFFRTKGCQMVLVTEDGNYRVFRHGDTVFFTGEPWWGSAPGLADGYIKE